MRVVTEVSTSPNRVMAGSTRAEPGPGPHRVLAGDPAHEVEEVHGLVAELPTGDREVVQGRRDGPAVGQLDELDLPDLPRGDDALSSAWSRSNRRLKPSIAGTPLAARARPPRPPGRSQRRWVSRRAPRCRRRRRRRCSAWVSVEEATKTASTCSASKTSSSRVAPASRAVRPALRPVRSTSWTRTKSTSGWAASAAAWTVPMKPAPTRAMRCMGSLQRLRSAIC